MTLNDEITAVENVVQFASDAANQHLERAEKDLHVESTGLQRCKDFLDATINNARFILARCGDMASEPAIAAEACTESIGRSLLAGVRESIRLMYVAMTVFEQFAGSARRGAAEHATAPRSCSFCGKTDAETKLVAGPVANICASCARLACGVLGI